MAKPLAIQQLTINNVRNLADIQLNPASGINIITGVNGAGKTSLLEAIHILARGRSFRTRKTSDWIRRGENIARVIAKINSSQLNQQTTTVGLERSRGKWQARINGETVKRFGDISRKIPLIVFEPNAHELISGGPEQRRAFLDWGVFHVEQSYLQSWRRFQRALRQRNVAIREQASTSVIHSLTPGIIETAQQLDEMREGFFGELKQAYSGLKQQLQPNIPDTELSYQRGWPIDQSLQALLHDELFKDQESGYTRYGPHRAEIRMQYQQRQIRGWLSRGQQKLTALLLLLAQQKTWETKTGITPIIMLDDLYSELDSTHSQKVLDLLANTGTQVWITATDSHALVDQAAKVFHVEQGKIVTTE